MVSRITKIRKIKKVRVSRTAAALANMEIMGEEPVFTQCTRHNFGDAFNWYSCMCDTDDAKQYLTAYLKSKNRKDDLKKLKKVPDSMLPKTAAWIARISSNGCVIDAENSQYFERALSRSFESIVEVIDVKKASTTKLTVQQNIREKANGIICEVEQMIDENAVLDIYEQMSKNQISAVVAGKVRDYYSPILAELTAAKNGDKEVAEGYPNRKRLNAQHKQFKQIVGDLDKYCIGAKQVRKTRKKKPVAVAKKISKVSYMKEIVDLKLVSVDPAAIIGASEVWLFNTTFDRLTVCRAIGRDGLDIKGSTILNFDTTKSEAKRIGRNKQKLLTQVKSGSKVVRRKLMGLIKAKDQRDGISGRLSANTLIIRVVK